MIKLKSPREIELMRKVCRLAAETLQVVGDEIRPGMTTLDIDRIVHEHTLSQGARPAPLNYKGFPKSVCTSVNSGENESELPWLPFEVGELFENVAALNVP